MAADPAQAPCEGAGCRAQACSAALRCLERALDGLAQGLHSADGRLMARVMREEVDG